MFKIKTKQMIRITYSKKIFSKLYEEFFILTDSMDASETAKIVKTKTKVIQ